MHMRRAGTSSKQRPATMEEVQSWSKTYSSLKEFVKLRQQHVSVEDTIKSMNDIIPTVPRSEDQVTTPDTVERMKLARPRLQSGLNEIKIAGKREHDAIAETLERLDALIAIRKGAENDKRAKRIRVASPSSVPGSPMLAGLNGIGAAGSNTPGQLPSGPNQGRSSMGPREILWGSQLPLQKGRLVAFRQPSQSKGGGRGHDNSVGDGDGETWIRAVVTRVVPDRKNTYEVQDQDTEDGEAGQTYRATIKDLLPLPDPTAPVGTPAHPSSYGEYAAGTTVLGLYPDTTCFYRAVVVAPPRDSATSSNGRSGKNQPAYKLKFEDDDDMVRNVAVQWVVAPTH